MERPTERPERAADLAIAACPRCEALSRLDIYRLVQVYVEEAVQRVKKVLPGSLDRTARGVKKCVVAADYNLLNDKIIKMISLFLSIGYVFHHDTRHSGTSIVMKHQESRV